MCKLETEQRKKTSFDIFKTTFVLGFPIILQELINSLVNLLDVFMVGKLGQNQISGVSTGNEIAFLSSILLFGITGGATIFTGQFWGKKDMKNFHRTTGLAIILSLISALIFFIPCQIIPEKLIGFYINDIAVIETGAKYIRIVSLTFFLNAILVPLDGALKSTNQTKLPFATSVVALISNFTLNYLFIFILKKGVVGAAIATVLARIIELTIQILLIKKLQMPIYTKFKNYFKIDKEFVVAFMKICTPVILNQIAWSVGNTLYRKAYGNLGKDAVAANAIISPISQLFMIFGIGLGNATGILIANSLGAEDKELAIEYSRKSTLLAVIMSSVMGIILFITSGNIINFFQVNEITKNSSQKIMYITSIMVIVRTMNYTMIVGILRNGGDTLYCLMIDLISVWFMGVPLALMGSYYFRFPVEIVYLMAQSEEILKFFITIKRVISNKWANTITNQVAKS